MLDTSINPPQWEFISVDGGWRLKTTNFVGSIELSKDGAYIARLDDLWEMKCSDVNSAMHFMKQRLASELIKKAEELNALAADLLDPGENPF
jgi:hypothetical protein